MKTIEEEIRSVVRSELLAVFGSFKRRGPGRPKGGKNKHWSKNPAKVSQRLSKKR